MFEILTEEQVKKMTDREIRVSYDLYLHNFSVISDEISSRNKEKENAFLADSLDIKAHGCLIHEKNVLSFKEPDETPGLKSKTRGRKKNVK